MGYAATNRNTTLRTVRLTRDLDNLLLRDAKAKRMSVNSLMTAIITKYTEWDRHAEKFGFVSLTRDGLRLILEAVDDNKLSQIGKLHGKSTNREFMMFWFKKINIIYSLMDFHYSANMLELLNMTLKQTEEIIQLLCTMT